MTECASRAGAHDWPKPGSHAQSQIEYVSGARPRSKQKKTANTRRNALPDPLCNHSMTQKLSRTCGYADRRVSATRRENGGSAERLRAKPGHSLARQHSMTPLAYGFIWVHMNLCACAGTSGASPGNAPLTWPPQGARERRRHYHARERGGALTARDHQYEQQPMIAVT